MQNTMPHFVQTALQIKKEKKFVLIYERLNEKENGDINPQVSG